MDSIYIVLITAGSVFAFLLLVYFVYAIEKAKGAKRRQQALNKVYSDRNLAKMEYSDVTCNEETNKILNRKSGQLTIDDVIMKDAPSQSESQKTDEPIFNKIETEGVEEITGKFKG